MRRLLLLTAVALLSGCGGAMRPAPISTPAPVTDAIPLGALPRQALAKGECALFLWIATRPARLVLMAKSAAPPFARISLDGQLIDLPRLDDVAVPAGGTNPQYGNGSVTASIDVTLEQRPGLTSGGVVTGGSLRIEQRSADAFVIPVSGMLGCG